MTGDKGFVDGVAVNKNVNDLPVDVCLVPEVGNLNNKIPHRVTLGDDGNSNNGSPSSLSSQTKFSADNRSDVTRVLPKNLTDVIDTKMFSKRALAAGGQRVSLKSNHSRAGTNKVVNTTGKVNSIVSDQYGNKAISEDEGKFLIIGDGLMAPFMALCLKMHGLDCDMAHHPSTSDLDRGTICMTPSVTQLMGDVLNVTVPSGSIVGRILTFDHVGNDLSDIDLNEFREKGESPTFFCCDRIKIEQALLSLCHVGNNACHVLTKPRIHQSNGLEALPDGRVRAHFENEVTNDYLGVICTARDRALIPELTVTQEELKQRQECNENYQAALFNSIRWLEVCVPPLPEIGKFEKRFTPGSQEIVEILTPRDAKMTVRPTMMATKLFYNVTMTIPSDTPDPHQKSTSLKQFWDDVAMHWTSGQPGYVSHTMFKAMFTHVQENFNRSTCKVFRSPQFISPHWQEGSGRLIKIAHAAHGSCFDAIDVSDAQCFTDCFTLARSLASAKTVDVDKAIQERKLQVKEEMESHSRLIEYGIKERGQLAYMQSRFMMKFVGKYKKNWRNILRNYVTLVPK